MFLSCNCLTAHRREVIEDLLDIQIFSSMNVLIKDKIRSIREETRTLELKRDSLKDKLKMQKEFIEQIEQSSKNDIKEKKEQIKNIAEEANKYIITNTRLVEEIDDLERVNIWTPDTLKKLDQSSHKDSNEETVNEETSFFNDHSVCPTCTQSIEEEFRLNRIGTLNASIEKLNEGLTDLDSKIEEEEKRESQYNELSKEVTSLNNEVSQNTVRVSGLQRQCRNLESEIQRIADPSPKIEILNMRS